MSKSIWEFYVSNKDTLRSACIAKWNSWLEKIPAKSVRDLLEQSLQSKVDAEHLSARLELYFYHHFKLS